MFSSLTSRLVRSIATLALLLPAASLPITAAPLANCDTAFTVCRIPENVLLQLPSVVVAGDTILLKPSTRTVSDVFRIFNDVVNTGAGTGLGSLVFLYSSDDIALPLPSSYSANAAFIAEDPSGITPLSSNGTTYLLAVPEPKTFVLLPLTGTLLFAWRRRFQRSKEVANATA